VPGRRLVKPLLPGFVEWKIRIKSLKTFDEIEMLPGAAIVPPRGRVGYQPLVWATLV
jgi:hypothetical protein